jgi:hypothetical protein
MKAAIPPAPSRLNVWLIGATGVGVAPMWIDNAPHFDLVDSRAEEHLTPAGLVQPFTWVVLRPTT